MRIIIAAVKASTNAVAVLMLIIFARRAAGVPNGDYDTFVVGGYTFTSSSPGSGSDMTVLDWVLFTNTDPENTLEITRTDGEPFAFVDLTGTSLASPWFITALTEFLSDAVVADGLADHDGDIVAPRGLLVATILPTRNRSRAPLAA